MEFEDFEILGCAFCVGVFGGLDGVWVMSDGVVL